MATRKEGSHPLLKDRQSSLVQMHRIGEKLLMLGQLRAENGLQQIRKSIGRAHVTQLCFVPFMLLCLGGEWR